MDIGARIRAARRRVGLSQEEVARRAGMSLKGMGDIERGLIEDPHFSSLRKIADALGVPIGELLEEEPVLSGGKVEAPESGHPDEAPEEEERHCLRALFGSWACHIDEQNAEWGPRLKALPDLPTPEEYAAGRELIEEAFSTYASILKALECYGVLEILRPFEDALYAERPVPEELRQAVIDLHNVFIPFYEYIYPRGINWTTRADEKHRVHTSELDKEREKWTKEWDQKLGMARSRANA